jgi:hypothetical protein
MKRSLACMGILLFSVGMSNGMEKRKSKFSAINSERVAKSKEKDEQENFGVLLTRWEQRDENVEPVDDNGNTMLHLAVLKRDPYWVNEFGSNASKNRLNKAGDAPIHLSVRDIPEETGLEIIQLLLVAGADQNLDSSSGTPLAIAIKQQKKKLIELLNNYHAQSNNTDYHDLPPKPVLKRTSFGKLLMIAGLMAGIGYYLYKLVKKKETAKIN